MDTCKTVWSQKELVKTIENNTKTINGNSIVGEGNIEIGGGKLYRHDINFYTSGSEIDCCMTIYNNSSTSISSYADLVNALNIKSQRFVAATGLYAANGGTPDGIIYYVQLAPSTYPQPLSCYYYSAKGSATSPAQFYATDITVNDVVNEV